MISYRIEIGGDDTGRTDIAVRFDGELRKDNADVNFILGIAQKLEESMNELRKTNLAHSGKTSETV